MGYNKRMSTKVSRNIFTLVFSRIIAAVLVFIAYAALFRYLGTYTAGQYQYVLSFVMLFSVVVDFGIQQLVIKKVSENKDEAQKYLGHFFAVELFLAIFIFGLLALIAYVSNYDASVFHAILLAGLGMVINALTIPYTAIISAHEDMHIIAIVNFFDSVINVSIIFAAIVFNQGIVFLAMVQLVNALIHIVVYNRIIHRYVPQTKLWHHVRNLDLTLVKKMFKLALPFGALVGFSIIYNKIDVIIITAFRGYSENGLYSAAYKFFDLVRFFPAVVSSSLYPYFSHQIALANIMGVRQSLEKYTKLMLALALPVAVGGAVLAEKLIITIGGEQYLPAAGALRWLCVAAAFVFIYAPVNSLIINQLTTKALKVTFVNIFINILGNLILVPRFGFKAAAFMTAVSEAMQLSLYFYFVRTRITSFPILKYLARPFIAAVLMVIAIYPLRHYSLVLTIPLGALVYGLVILVSGFFNKEDFAAAKSLIGGRFRAAN